jgi:serine protease Do
MNLQIKRKLILLTFITSITLLLTHYPLAAEDTKPARSVKQAEKAIIRIETVGTFRPFDRDEQKFLAGTGSGFIIDPSGIAVTNAHVVNGGALYHVYVEGETKARNAKVLGIAECADLAVIDIDGEGFPYLEWRRSEVKSGDTVYAAGYPHGVEELQLTSGAIVNPSVTKELDWASVDKVRSHTAKLEPGNSGGPLLDHVGRVVGVNFAGSRYLNRYVAISNDTARLLVEELRTGIDVDSIGVSGVAFDDGDKESGIWVLSVKSGAPADVAGILPGDTISKLEGLPVGIGGTMSTYCDILRSHRSTDVLNIEIIRADTKELLLGQINGRPLGIQSTEKSMLPAGYVTISDETGTISLNVPESWTNIANAGDELSSSPEGPTLIATSEDYKWNHTVRPPGVTAEVFVSVSPPKLDSKVDNLLKNDDCKFISRQEYEDAHFSGFVNYGSTCYDVRESGAAALVITPKENNQIIVSLLFYMPEWDEEFDIGIVIAPLVQSLQKPIKQTKPTQSTDSTAIVLDAVNVRIGPGTQYNKIGLIAEGDTILVLGKSDENCRWVYVEQGILSGWVSTNPQYIELDRDCEEVSVFTENITSESSTASGSPVLTGMLQYQNDDLTLLYPAFWALSEEKQGILFFEGEKQGFEFKWKDVPFDAQELLRVQKLDPEKYNEAVLEQEQKIRELLSDIGEIVNFSSKSSNSIGQYWSYGNQYHATIKVVGSTKGPVHYYFATFVCGKTRVCSITYLKQDVIPFSDKDQAIIISVVNSTHFEED